MIYRTRPSGTKAFTIMKSLVQAPCPGITFVTAGSFASHSGAFIGDQVIVDIYPRRLLSTITGLLRQLRVVRSLTAGTL